MVNMISDFWTGVFIHKLQYLVERYIGVAENDIGDSPKIGNSVKTPQRKKCRSQWKVLSGYG